MGVYPNLKGKFILVAEDEETNFLFIREALKKTNADLIWVQNGAEAVDIVIENSNINLILMDLKMPVMNGYDAIKEIHELKPDLPIIAQTAYAVDSEQYDFLTMKNVQYMPKPFRVKDLLLRLEKLFANTKTETQNRAS